MQNPYARYKEQSVMTMTQGDMINLLFDEVINRLNKGLVSLEQNDYEGSNAHFKKAYQPHWITSMRCREGWLPFMNILTIRSFRRTLRRVRNRWRKSSP